jgi:hypothetical protein
MEMVVFGVRFFFREMDTQSFYLIRSYPQFLSSTLTVHLVGPKFTLVLNSSCPTG